MVYRTCAAGSAKRTPGKRMFWTWLRDMPGSLLAVPLLMTFKILCDHFKPLAPIGEFLSG